MSVSAKQRPNLWVTTVHSMWNSFSSLCFAHCWAFQAEWNAYWTSWKLWAMPFNDRFIWFGNDRFLVGRFWSLYFKNRHLIHVSMHDVKYFITRLLSPFHPQDHYLISASGLYEERAEMAHSNRWRKLSEFRYWNCGKIIFLFHEKCGKSNNLVAIVDAIFFGRWNLLYDVLWM